MKKIIILVILFIIVLNGCGQQPSSDIDTPTYQNKNVEINNDDEVEKHYWTVNYECIPKDESKGEVYNTAIEAYNKFLAKEAEETLKWFNDDDKGLTSPLPYAYLKDLHGDGIPEIIVRFDPVYPEQVFSYIDGVVVELAGPRSNNAFNLRDFDEIDTSMNGWQCLSLDRSKSSYGEILETINNKPIVALIGAFDSCTSLTEAPVIPSSVINMNSTFMGCTSLTGEVEINANPSYYGNCFYNTVKPITITGSTTKKAKLAATANYGNVTY